MVRPAAGHGNQTVAYAFIILGFNTFDIMERFLFYVICVTYILTLGVHSVIVTLVVTDRKLHKPMYVFLANFSIAEILYTTASTPKMLDSLWTKNKEISYSACLAQFYCFFAFGAVEHFFLVIMGYDRYVAIRQPLQYTTTMTRGVTLWMVFIAWLLGCLAAGCPAVWIATLTFCFPNVIDAFFCDYAPLINMSCDDTTRGEFAFTVVSWSMCLSCFLLTVISYTLIICSVLKIPSVTGRKKAFSTCASHLTVVLIFSGTIIFMYVRPNSRVRFAADKVVSIFYAVVTPLMNPMIYCMRNKDVKDALKRALIPKRVIF